jgi:4-hydroxy 2-oxovalerate aldolase
MITQSEYAAGGLTFPLRSQSTPDMIRLAYFKPEAEDALYTARILMDKGYIVFLQAMATFMYTRDELTEHLRAVNSLRPHAFYIVDSFSTLYPDDIKSMQDFVLAHLDRGIAFGLHAHNNIQLAFANAITFLNNGDGRLLYTDGSIYGMGRGAGNVPIELLLEYANKHCGGVYDVGQALDVFDRRIKPIFKMTPWGYSIPYLLTASKNMNSVYGWYLMSHGVNELHEYMHALDMIPEEERYTLSRRSADAAIQRCREVDTSD